MVDGQAARPRDLFIRRGAETQAVGRVGGAAEAVFSRRGAHLAGPLRTCRARACRGGGWGVGTALARDHVRFYTHILESQSSFLEC